MPKTSNKIDYTITPVSFYRFVCKTPEIKSSYVGNTTNFAQRKYSHKTVCNNPNSKSHNYKIYQTIRANGGWDNWTMIEIISKICESKRDADRQEQEYMTDLQTDMNTYKSFIGDKTEYLKSRQKQYYAKNADKINTRQKQYDIEHAEERKAYYKQRYIANKEQQRQRSSSI